MGFLRVDYSEAGGFDALPVGEYEAIVSAVEVTQTKGGEGKEKKPMLKATLTIREDVEQAGKKRKLFDNMVWQDSLMWKFQQVAKAVQIPEGEDIETLEDFANAIAYKAVRIRVGQRTYNGEVQNDIKGWGEPKFEGGGAVGNPNAGGTIDVSDDDLPF